MAQSKKTNTTKTRASSAPKSKPPAAATKKPDTAKVSTAKKTVSDTVPDDVAKRQRIAILLLASGVFVFCLALFEGQNAWLWMHEALFGIFGVCAWSVPILLLALCVIFAANKPLGNMTAAFICAGFFVVMLSGIVHVGFHDNTYIAANSFDVQIKNCWECETVYNNGGVLGALVGATVAKMFGKIPAMITMILALFVVFMFFSGTTLVALYSMVTRPVKKVGEMAEERIGHGMKRYEETTEKREQKRLEKEAERQAILEQSGQEQTDVEEEPNKTEEQTEKQEKPEKPKKAKNGEFNPDFPIGPDALPAIDYELNDNFMPDFLYADNDKSQRVRADIPISPPVLVSTPIDIEQAIKQPDAEKPKSKKEPVKATENVSKTTEKALPEEESEEIFEEVKSYRKPPISCLSLPPEKNDFGNASEIEYNSKLLIKTLDSFGVKASIIDVCRGPSVTRYELVPAEGVKISKITNLADDLALRLASSGVRIEAPIPNKAAIGIEVPNKSKVSVVIREIIDTDIYRKGCEKSLLNVALGKDITGNVICVDLAKMPHLLIAGTTGSGKSVCINSMIMSILFNADPEEVKLLMIDPKQVEFTVYSGIPHLLVPVVSDARKASGALGWAVTEMLSRYKKFADKNVRDISGYNKLAQKSPEIERMNRIVIFIDELSDLMMVAQNEVEDSICRLAQMARAAGMHLVIATQRPSVDVITGVIKANIPSRIALSVSSPIDSRIIIDTAGAEKLLGYGDMLYNPVGISKPMRVQGCFVSDGEVERVTSFIKTQEESSYDEEIMDEIERQAIARKKSAPSSFDDEESGQSKPVDEKLQKAIEVVVEAQMASTTLLQRKLSLGYARAAKLIDELEERKIVGPFQGSKPRKVLITKQQWMEMCALSQDGLPDLPPEGTYDDEDSEDDVSE